MKRRMYNKQIQAKVCEKSVKHSRLFKGTKYNEQLLCAYRLENLGKEYISLKSVKIWEDREKHERIVAIQKTEIVIKNKCTQTYIALPSIAFPGSILGC